MRKLGLVLTVLCLGCLLAFPAASQARNLYFGINANTRAWENPGQEQDLVAETGAGWLREDFEWEVVEPADDEWVWTDTDELFQDAAERGMKILPILNSPPCWAAPKETDPEDCWETWPASNSEFAEFTAEAVKRYGPSGDFWDERPLLDNDLAPRYWEVWNEPYYPEFTNDEVNPARYASLFKAAAIAGDEANGGTDYLIESVVDATVKTEVDPKGWVHWAEEIVDAEPTIGNYIDGIAIHPYPESNDPEYEPENGTDASFLNTGINYERWLEEGINRPVWITEVGYSSCDDGADRCVPGATQLAREEKKAEWLSWLLDELGDDDYAFVHAVFLYNLRQWPTAPNANFSSWLGIVDKDGEPLLAWNSFATAVEEYDGVPVPNTFITGQTITATTAEFSFGVNDPTSSLECQLDAGSWTACTSPKKYTGVGAGAHTFRVRATNAEATESGPATYSWSTLPTATTEAVSNVKTGEVTLNGTVNPQGSSTTYQFEYGATTAYGNVVPISPKSAGSGTSAVKASAEISGLSANTLYHYRIVATNAGGTTKGADRTFAIKSLSVLDNLQRDELPLATGSWSKAKWAGEIGGAWNSGGYLGFGSNSASTVTAAYWNPTTFSDSGVGDMVAATVGSGSPWAGEYLAIWLNMPEPSKAQSGYEARFTGVNGSSGNYKVELSKWVSGTRTILASTSGFSLSVGTTIALGQLGGELTLWAGASGLSPVLSASDSTYTSGYAGLEVYGVGGTEYNFKAG